MAARSLADRFMLALPALVALLLMLLVAAPWHLSDLPLKPHVLWLMTITFGVAYPAAWPLLTAFLLGLVADTLSGTPLGAQALVTVLMALGLRGGQARRMQHQLFRIRWAESIASLLVLHLMLWGIVAWMGEASLPLRPVLVAVAVNVTWYPLFYLLSEGLVRLLPPKG